MKTTNTSDQHEHKSLPTHRWRWLWIWLLLVGMTALLVITLITTLNTTLIPAMLLFGALTGPVAFFVFVGDRFDLGKALPIFNVTLVILFGGTIGVIIGGTLDTWIIGDPPTLQNILWVGPIEEIAKLILPVIVFLFGHKKYKSTKAGLILGLASAVGFTVLETMGYGLNQILTSAGALLSTKELHSHEIIKAFEKGGGVSIFRGFLTPFGHLVWTGMVTVVWWSEWSKHQKICITKSVVGVLFLSIFLHSANDFLEFSLAKSSGIMLVAHLLAILAIFGISLFGFWITAKKKIQKS